MIAQNPESHLEQWQRAMEAAAVEGLQAEKINDVLYAVRSTSKATCSKHLVHLKAGKVVGCDLCPGWTHYKQGTGRPCKHAGAVARRLMRERHLTMPVRTPVQLEVIEGTARRSLFRVEVA